MKNVADLLPRYAKQLFEHPYRQCLRELDVKRHASAQPKSIAMLGTNRP